MTSFDLLRGSVAGPVLTPGEQGFSEEVSGFNLAVSHAPDVVVGVTSAADVSEAVHFAAREGLPVRVQATGHGAQRSISGGMLLSTRRLDEVTVDPESRIASIGAGATWRAVQAVAIPLGLTAITGSSMTVGAVGYTLGGGLGPLARSHGFTSDYVRGFEVVTATGEQITASADENPELFWALRGGKVGLGIVTAMKMELVPLTTVYAGSLFFDEQNIETSLRGWIDWVPTAPEDVTTSIAILNLPDIAELPPPLRGKRVLSLRFAYPGDASDGTLLAAPLRALAPALIDGIAPLSTANLGEIHGDPEQPTPGWHRGMMLRALDQDFATALLGHVGMGSSAPLACTEVRHIGATTNTDVDGGSAVGGRSSGHTLFLIGAPDPGLFEAVLPAVTDALVESVLPWISDETTINFADSPNPEIEFAKAWPNQIHERLQAVRALNDPGGLFTYGPGGA